MPTFKEVRAKGLRKPSAIIQPVSPDQEFLARNAGKRIDTSEPIPGEDEAITEGGNVWQRRPGTVTMYKPTPNGYMPRLVPATSIAVNLANGFRTSCPHCNGQHGPDPNDCPGREPTAVRVCPVCAKRIYDNRVVMEIEDDGDPNVIHDAAYASSTPATRTKAALDLHLWRRHPQESREMGLAPLPEEEGKPLGGLEVKASTG